MILYIATLLAACVSVVQGSVAPVDLADANSQPLHSPCLLYTRNWNTGLGDRLTGLLCVAAMGVALNATVHMPWAKHGHGSQRNYDLSSIEQFVRLPRSIVLHSSETVGSRVPKGCSTLSHNGGTLHASKARDCVYTTCLYTFPDYLTRSIPAAAFEQAYRQAAQSFTVSMRSTGLPVIEDFLYLAVHVRVGDRYSDRDADYLKSGMELVQRLHVQYPFLPIVVVTDDASHVERLRVPYRVISRGDLTGREKTKQELHDLAVLLNACAIVQISPDGWSAFSSLASMARQIPLINSDPNVVPRNNILYMLDELHKRPSFFYNMSTPEQILFAKQVQDCA